MGAFDSYAVDGFVESLVQLFGLVPVGFLLGMLVGILSLGVFGLISLVRKVM